MIPTEHRDHQQYDEAPADRADAKGPTLPRSKLLHPSRYRAARATEAPAGDERPATINVCALRTSGGRGLQFTERGQPFAGTAICPFSD